MAAAANQQKNKEVMKKLGGGGGGVVVVMVPFPAQGHLNQLLHLSRLISSNNNNVSVHYVASVSHAHQAQLRVQGWDPLLQPNFQFHHFPTPLFQSPPPNPNASFQFPAHLESSFQASLQLRHPVAALLRQLSPTARRIIVVHDSLMGSVIQDVASILNAESYTFHSVSAFSIFLFLWEAAGKPPLKDQVNHLLLLQHHNIPSLDGCFTLEFLDFIATQHQFKKLNSGNIYNTCKSIEGCYVDLLDALEIYGGKKKHWALGPFNPVRSSLRLPNNNNDKNKSNPRHHHHQCLEWLDKQAPMSVLLVSFGTTTSLTDEQIKELAIGLERSKQKFIWVLRDADKGDIFSSSNSSNTGGEEENRRTRRSTSSSSSAELPKGYEERLRRRGMGLVVRDWAPQLEILGHSSTGGFMSHCGWNSCLESISMGVPLAAWPMHSDQPRNTVLVAQVLKVGLVVRDWAQRHQVVAASTVENKVRRLMASKEGDEMRQRVADLGDTIRRSMDEGGVSRKELDSFIAHITR